MSSTVVVVSVLILNLKLQFQNFVSKIEADTCNKVN